MVEKYQEKNNKKNNFYRHKFVPRISLRVSKVEC